MTRLAILMSLFAAGFAWALWTSRVRPRAWLVIVALQALLLGAGLVAINTGGAEEERVEDVIVQEGAILRPRPTRRGPGRLTGRRQPRPFVVVETMTIMMTKLAGPGEPSYADSWERCQASWRSPNDSPYWSALADRILGAMESPGHWVSVASTGEIFVRSLTGNVFRWYPGWLERGLGETEGLRHANER